MDHNFDYLLPTCMLRSRALGNHGNKTHQENHLFNIDTDNVFNDTLKVLESDTCSEISDKSYAEASYYTRMKVYKSPYLEKQFWADNEDYKAPWERNQGSQFDRSLQQFLEWPENCSESDEEDVFTSNFNDTVRLKHRPVERKRRSSKSRMVNQKRMVIPKLAVNSDTVHSSDSDNSIDDVGMHLLHLKSVHRLNNKHIENVIERKVPKCNKSVDSDSDYRTCSDTSSCDKIDLTFSAHDVYNESDFKSLKYLTASIVHKSDDIFVRLSQSTILNEFNHKTTKGVNKKSRTGVVTHENTKLVRTLGKKEGELENFRDLLEKAQNSLTKSQEVVEDLEERLQAERCKCKERAGQKRVVDNDDTSRLRHQLADLQIQLEEQEKLYQSKCKELDMVAHKLNIKVTTQSDNTDHSDMLQKIMGELQHLKGAVEGERHLHIDINSTHTSPNKDVPNSCDLDVVRPGPTNNRASVGGKNGSHVPVLTKSATSDECESLRKQVADLKAQVHHLQNMLKATEETVHRQTQKMKHYRNMLIENGLLSRSRSNSVSDLPSARANRSMTRKMSADSISPRGRSLSPTHVGRRQPENSEEFEKLVKNNIKLKEQVEGYRRVLKVFQSRSPSPNDELDKSNEKISDDADTAPMSFESASCVLKSWFEMLDKYLVERSESQLPASSIEVSRLRRGLVQARDALRSMSCSALDQDKLSEGRLSPDSGCSDNPTSAQNTLKESPSSSPKNRKSTSPQFTVTSPDRVARLVQNESQSRETYRHGSVIPSMGNMSMFSHIDPNTNDTSVFSTASVKSKASDLLRPELTSPPTLPNLSPRGNSSVNQPKHLHNKHLNIDQWEQSFMPKLLDESSLADITNLGQQSLIRFEDISLLDITSQDNQHNKTCMADMKEQIKTLEDIINKYEIQIRQKSQPDMDSLQQQLAELRHLRIQLEKALAWNAALEKQLIELYNSSECTIHELRSKLEDSEHCVLEKVKIITEKEKIISETRISLGQFKDNSSKAHERVKSLEDMCAQLRNAVEQYQKRCSKLQEDNKSHMEAVSRYQTRVKDLEKDAVTRSEQRSQAEALRSRIDELESEVERRQENELTYKKYLEQTRSQVTKLTGELDETRAEMDKSNSELYNVKMELENLRDVVEEQNQQLGDKTTLIDKLQTDMKVKDICLNEQDALCQDLTSKLECVTASGSKLSSQLDQHRQTCASYKKQIEEQDAVTQDLKDQVDQLRDKLAQSMQQRESQDKLLQEKDDMLKETTKLNEKYVYNLKVRYKQCLNYKKELAETKKKCEDTSVLNNTLQTELSVRQQLMENQGDMLTDDDKHKMIQQLLNELRLASLQMTKILQQNENIKQKMTELIEHKKQELNRIGGDKPGGRKSSESVDRLSFEDTGDDSFGSNQTWPLYDDLTDGLPRTDNLSSSLPLGSRKSGSRHQEDKNPLEPYLIKQTLKEVPAGGSGNQFSVPGPIYKQGITDDCLMYNVNDSPKYLQGLTQVKIDSDMRSLFAIGMIDHFEKLRKETNESSVILKGLSTRVTERLKVFNTMPALESKEYGIMKEISYAVENLRICCDSQLSLVGFFWTSELPCPNERGEFVNQKLLDRNALLREEVSRLREKLNKDSNGLQRSEDMICERLESTLNVISHARHNLEHRQQQHRPNSPYRSPSRSPRK
ncbi:uncharacterized protein LOC132746118 isoform X2 [Ruditapes philippinarum]|uniref:uncharacterized protein LOC132746118 isoform X2 n=1 Tax=Ruditapes philippinarum TaxID=129788 RepID=UPI00295C315D|nr:uncharacterized protein LOC132746118 isoform X2 [Ruditapes philippinarum]